MRPILFLVAGLAAVVAIAFVFAPQLASARGVGLHLAPWALTALLGGASAYLVAILLPRVPLAGVLAAGVLTFLVPWPALANAGGTSVDFGQVVAAAITVVSAAILAIGRAAVNALVAYFEQKTRLELDDHTRAYLDHALEQALRFGLNKATVLVGQDAAKIDVHNAAVATAMQYALDRVPDALTHFGIGSEALGQMLEARLLRLVQRDNPALAVAPAPAAA